jgi:hypothetical protein
LSAILKDHLCPQCGGLLNAATSIDGEWKPEAGDLSICLECGAFLVFNQDQTVRKMAGEELKKLPATNPIQFQQLMDVAVLCAIYRQTVKAQTVKREPFKN